MLLVDFVELLPKYQVDALSYKLNVYKILSGYLPCFTDVL